MDRAVAAPEATPAEEAVYRNALRFAFASAAPHYAAERPLWGLAVSLRVLDADELQVADELAGRVWQSEPARQLERSAQWVARALVAVDGEAFDAPLEERLSWARSRPGPLLAHLTDLYLSVAREYEGLFSDQSRKNS